MKHSSLTRLAAWLLVLILTAATLPLIFTCASTSAASNIVITLDPGHGPGGVGTTGAEQFGGKSEHLYTYSIATYAKERLQQYGGVTVYFTRTAGETPGLSARAQTAASYVSDAFVSIHINAAGNGANGTEVWIPNSNWRPAIAANSRSAAERVLGNLVSSLSLKNRGIKTRNSANGTTYPDGSLADYYTVIKAAKEKNISTIMLIEVAFADNQSDYNKVFATEEGLRKAGYAIADGLAAYYGLSSAPSLVHVSNDELRYLSASGGQIGQAFTPGQFDSWKNKVIELERGSVHSLMDWGWAAMNCKSFRYGYMINGKEYFKDEFTHEAEAAVAAAFAALGASNGSRFKGILPVDQLKTGTNTVQFCVRMNGTVTAILREYTVIVTEKATEPPTEPPTEAPTEPPTEAPTEAPTEPPTEAPTEAPTEPPTEAPTEPPTEAPTEATTEPPTEAPTEAPTEPATEAPTEAPTEPPTEAPTEAPTEPETEPVTEPVTEPSTEPSTDAPTDAPTEPSTEPPTEPVPEAPTDVPNDAPTNAPTDAPTDTETDDVGGCGASLLGACGILVVVILGCAVTLRRKGTALVEP